jgi:DNA-binding LytR/AlgR family response regulator
LLKQPTKNAFVPEKPNNFIFIKSDKKSIKLNIQDIEYVEGLGDYIKIYTSDKKLVTNLTMKKIENQLPSTQFYRIHKSFIISMDKIDSIEGNMVKLKNTVIPIGKSYRQDFMEHIKNFLAE